jgi:hypothetical protein
MASPKNKGASHKFSLLSLSEKWKGDRLFFIVRLASNRDDRTVALVLIVLEGVGHINSLLTDSTPSSNFALIFDLAASQGLRHKMTTYQ